MKTILLLSGLLFLAACGKIPTENTQISSSSTSNYQPNLEGIWTDAAGDSYQLQPGEFWASLSVTVTPSGQSACSCKIYFENNTPDPYGNYFISSCTDQSDAQTTECTNIQTSGAFYYSPQNLIFCSGSPQVCTLFLQN